MPYKSLLVLVFTIMQGYLCRSLQPCPESHTSNLQSPDATGFCATSSLSSTTFFITNRHWTEHRQHFITHKPNAHDNINARLKGIAIADSTLAGYWMLMLASALLALRRFRYDINVAFVIYERCNAFCISLFSTEVCNSGHTCGLLWVILLTQTLYRYSSTFREILMLLFNTNFTEEKK